MRGTAAILVCLISLQYLSAVDAFKARFTSENGMPGHQHEDQYPPRSIHWKRSYPKKRLQEYDYNGEDYGGIPNIPGYMYKDAYADVGIDEYEDADRNDTRGISPKRPNPKDHHSRRSAAAKQNLTTTTEDYDYPPDRSYRQNYTRRNESIGEIIDGDTGTDQGNSTFSRTLQHLLSPVVDAMRQLWGKLGGKQGDNDMGDVNKRETKRSDHMKKRAMKNRRGENRGNTSAKDPDVSAAIRYLGELAMKALEFVYDIVNSIDVSQFTEDVAEHKEAVLEMLKKTRDAFELLLEEVTSEAELPQLRRSRSVGKRTNARDALKSYLTGLKSHKRSKARSSLRRSMKGITPARPLDMLAVMDLMTEIEDCIQNIPPTNTSRLGVKCIVLPLMKVLASPKQGGANDSTTDPDVRSDAIESPDNTKRLHFPWGNIFLIPIYTDHHPGRNITTPPFRSQESENATETTTATTTTEEPMVSNITETTTTPVPDVPVKKSRIGKRYQSKYDHGF